MPARTSKHSGYTRMQHRVVSQTKASLQDLPEKKKEILPLQEAIHQLHAPLKAALTKGYSYQELATMLQQQGISISVSTLKRYLSSDKQKASKNRASSKLRGKSSENPLEKPNSGVLQTKAPWWLKVAGSFEGDPTFDKAVRLGQEWRKSAE